MQRRPILVGATGAAALLLASVGAADPQVTPSDKTAAGAALPASATTACASSVYDQATGGCLQASSTPTPGMLFPPPHDGGVNCTMFGLGAFTGGGRNNDANGSHAVVTGGYNNLVNGHLSTVGGGYFNDVEGSYATVGGGFTNSAGGVAATVPGGFTNDAPGTAATVGGGAFNTASGAYAFAAGYSATAAHSGSFVWSDRTGSFQSTGNDQFLVDASGGMGIGTDNPGGAQLNVAGAIHSSGPTGGSFLIFNPNNAGASAHFSWKDDVARFRVGGNGPGANGGFDFQRIGDQSIMRLTDSRRVGIGTTAPAEKLQVIGNICATGTIGVCSDERFKTDVEPLEGALAKVLALRGVEYDWRRDEFPAHEFTDARQVGLIAQEVLQVVPEVVSEGGDGMYSVDYGKLTPVLVEAIREQQQAFEVQRDALERQTEEIAALRDLVADLRRDLGARETRDNREARDNNGE